MKHVLKIAILALSAFSLSGCSLFNDMTIDTPVEWGFAANENSAIVYDPGTYAFGADVIAAFDEVFTSKFTSTSGHRAIMKAQKSERMAKNNAKSAAETALAKCKNSVVPMDAVFVVRIGFNTEGAEANKTVWTHKFPTE